MDKTDYLVICVAFLLVDLMLAALLLWLVSGLARRAVDRESFNARARRFLDVLSFRKRFEPSVIACCLAPVLGAVIGYFVLPRDGLFYGLFFGLLIGPAFLFPVLRLQNLSGWQLPKDAVEEQIEALARGLYRVTSFAGKCIKDRLEVRREVNELEIIRMALVKGCAAYELDGQPLLSKIRGVYSLSGSARAWDLAVVPAGGLLASDIEALRLLSYVQENSPWPIFGLSVQPMGDGSNNLLISLDKARPFSDVQEVDFDA